jgi:3-oxoadipate enol-lactonase
MSSWLLVGIVGVGTVALKGIGPLLLGGRQLPERLTGVVSLLAPTLLAALIVTQTFAAGTALVIDARVAGVAAAVIAIVLRAPILVVIVVAAAGAAATRAVVSAAVSRHRGAGTRARPCRLAAQPARLGCRVMPVFENDGRPLYYEVHGEGEPLVCVMGLAADHLAWTLQVPAWSRRFKTVVFDNRDAGQSFRPEGPYDVTDMAQDTLALADGLGLERFHLLGMSLGGTIAQEVALAAPDRVRTLTLVVTFAWGGRWGREFARLWSHAAAQRSDEEHLDWLILQTVSEEFYENEQAVEFLRNVMRANPHPQPRDAFIRQLEAGARKNTRDQLGALSMPVHVIGAEHDLLVPVWKSKEIAALVPGAELSIVPGAPHGLNVERAEEFNALVVDFIASAGEGAQAPAPAAASSGPE